MPLPPFDNCTAARIFATYRPLEYPLFGCLSSSAFALGVFSYVVRSAITKKLRLTYHRNLKILGSIAALLCGMTIVANMLQGAYYQFIRLFAAESCAYATVGWACMLQVVPQYVALCGFTLLHLLVFVERLTATVFLNTYQHIGLRAIAAPLGIATVLLLWWTFYVFAGEDIYAMRSHCMLTTPTNAPKVAKAVHVLLVIDVLAAVGDLFLVVANRRQRRRKIHDYNLQKAYQVKENDISLKVVLPLSVIHSLAYSLFMLSSWSVRSFFGDVDLFLYVTLLEWTHALHSVYSSVPLLAFYLIQRRFEHTHKRQQTNKEIEADFHFRQLQAYFDSALPPALKSRRRLCYCYRIQ